MRRSVFVLGAVLVLAACADPHPVAPPPARSSLELSPSFDLTPAQATMATFVAMGTSNSMGVASAGIYAEAQRAAWPTQLARRAGVSFTVPYILDPGCGPPLQPPLIADLALVAGLAALGEDLVGAVMRVCMPLRDGITLPTNQLAISGAKAADALYTTPESEAAVSPRTGEMYSRVLPPGYTQVTAMQAQHPTFVSVELAANEVLPASTGRISAMTPFEQWKAVYDEILSAVQTTGAKGVLVGVPNDARNFPSIRRAREFFNEWAYLLTLGITVSFNCYFSSNYLFIPGYVLTLVQKAPTTATCSDVPGAADYVLTSSDMTAINARMAQMNAHMQAKASEMGFAYFSLSALYDLPKGSFRMYDVLFSNTPFGPNISLDGVHPSAAGQTILANAAVEAINARYGLGIP